MTPTKEALIIIALAILTHAGAFFAGRKSATPPTIAMHETEQAHAVVATVATVDTSKAVNLDAVDELMKKLNTTTTTETFNCPNGKLSSRTTVKAVEVDADKKDKKEEVQQASKAVTQSSATTDTSRTVDLHQSAGSSTGPDYGLAVFLPPLSLAIPTELYDWRAYTIQAETRLVGPVWGELQTDGHLSVKAGIGVKF